jgi:small subunit ribosomal protein S17
MAKTTTAPSAKPAGADQQPEKKIVTFRGTVTSDSREKTRTVVYAYQARHPKYGKYLRKQTVLQVHDEDNQSKSGDIVDVVPCRPMSRTKTWRVLRVVERKPKDV